MGRPRYIAITDGEDTDKGLSDFVPIKNIFNEFYARDTSRKVKASFSAKFRAGERISAYAPIGYKKDPECKNHLVIDEETRGIIEKIFDLALHGDGAARITKKLIEAEIPTPGWLNYRRDGTFANIYEDAPEEKRYAWTVAQVKSILKDETYIGNTIHYRETSVSYKSKRRVRRGEEEHLRVEGTHEAIISKDDFERVQELIKSRRRAQKSQTTQIFAGLLKCADCGWSLKFGTNRLVHSTYSYYCCSRYGQMGKRACSMHYIRYDALYAVILARLQYWAAQAITDQETLLRRILDAQARRGSADRKQDATELKRAEKRLEELDRLFAKL